MLYRITLHLARTPAFPNGSARHGYDIVAPLDASGHLDAHAWMLDRDSCRVRRFWGEEDEREGRLIHRAGGAGGATWLIDYDDAAADDDETGYRLDRHLFIPGEYVTIADHDGQHPFRVASVDALSS